MKKALAMILSFAMLLALAVGCESNSAAGNSSSSGDTTDPKDTKGTVEFMYWGGEQKEAME